MFTLTAVAAIFYGAAELWTMQAGTPEQFGRALRWGHVPAWMLILSLVGFVRFYLKAGRPWLAWTICGLRTLALFLNFVTGANLNFREITAIRKVLFLGEPVSIPVGMPNPCMLAGHLGLILLVIFVVDATLAVWRRGDRRQAFVVGSSIVFFVSVGSGQVILALWGIFPMPIITSLFYMGIVAAMGFELSHNLLRAAELSDELREIKQRMDLATSATDLGLWVWDITRDDIWSTDKGRELFGVEKTEPVNFARFAETLHPDDREPVRAAIATALENNGDYQSEHRVLSDNAPLRWIAARGRVEFDADHRPLRMHGISIDITARKQAEQEVQERRAELTHLSRLAMLGELSGSFAHELNQPLAAILSNAQAAQRFLARLEIDRAEMEDIVRDIVDATRHASEVIRNLHRFLKKNEMQRQSFNMNEVVREALKLLRSDLLAYQVAVETELAPDLPVVCGDRVQFQQVLLNFVMNACDAMAGNNGAGRRLRVSTGPIMSDGVRVSVRDNGCGIPEEALERIFEPFFTTKPQGLGLGLAICHSILSAHDGVLSAENHPGGGAVFHFTLPAGLCATT